MSGDLFRIQKKENKPQTIEVDDAEKLRLAQIEVERQKLELERKRIEKEKREKAKADKEKSQQFNKEELVSIIQSSVYGITKPLQNEIDKVAERLVNSLIHVESKLTDINQQITVNNNNCSGLSGIHDEIQRFIDINFKTDKPTENVNDTFVSNLQEMPIEKLMFLYYMLSGKTIRKNKQEIIENIKKILQ